MVRRELLDELEVILKDDYGLELSGEFLTRFANDLVSYFSLLNKVDSRIDKMDYENDKQKTLAQSSLFEKSGM